VNGFQHEQPDYWLTFGNPWEIERLIVSYPIKFYGHVSVHQEEGRQVFRWNAGEQVGCCCCTGLMVVVLVKGRVDETEKCAQ
jgi:glucan phosphorylase